MRTPHVTVDEFDETLLVEWRVSPDLEVFIEVSPSGNVDVVHSDTRVPLVHSSTVRAPFKGTKEGG